MLPENTLVKVYSNNHQIVGNLPLDLIMTFFDSFAKMNEQIGQKYSPEMCLESFKFVNANTGESLKFAEFADFQELEDPNIPEKRKRFIRQLYIICE